MYLARTDGPAREKLLVAQAYPEPIFDGRSSGARWCMERTQCEGDSGRSLMQAQGPTSRFSWAWVMGLNSTKGYRTDKTE